MGKCQTAERRGWCPGHLDASVGPRILLVMRYEQVDIIFIVI